MEDLNDKITGNTLEAQEFVQPMSEIQNVIEQLGQTLTSSDLNQLGKGIAGYVANSNFYTDSGIADAYVLSKIGSKQTATAYTDGFLVTFVATNRGTGAATVNVSGIGVKNIKLRNGSNPLQSDVSGRVTLQFDSSNNWFSIVSPKVTGGLVDASVFGYDPDGSTDQTSTINLAMAITAAAGRTLVVGPGVALFDSEILIANDNPNGNVSNLRMIMMPGCIWRAGINFSEISFVRIKNVSNVLIMAYGATIDGNFLNNVNYSGVGQGTQDLAFASGLAGGRHFCIAFSNGAASSNVTIKGIHLKDAGQDNLYVANGDSDVTIEDVTMSGAVRNNESIISAVNYTSKNCTYVGARQWWTDDFGYGVDIEPVVASHKLEHIKHINPTFIKNYDGGYRLGPGGAVDTDMHVECINPVDYDSGWNFTSDVRSSAMSDSYELASFNNSGVANHDFSLINPKSYRANGSGIALIRRIGDIGKITVSNPEIYDWNQLNSSSPANQNAIGFSNTDSGTQTLELHVIGTPVIKQTSETVGEFAINGSLRGKSANANWDLFWIERPQITGITTANIYGVNNNSGVHLQEGHVDPRTCSFQVYLTVTQTISNSTDTVIAWTTSVEDHDVNKSFASGVYTAPMDGVYEFNLEATFSNAPANSPVEAHIKTNGGTRKRTRFTSGNAAGSQTAQATFMALLSKGDTVEAACRQESGGNLDLLTGANRWTMFSGKLIG